MEQIQVVLRTIHLSSKQAYLDDLQGLSHLFEWVVNISQVLLSESQCLDHQFELTMLSIV